MLLHHFNGVDVFVETEFITALQARKQARKHASTQASTQARKHASTDRNHEARNHAANQATSQPTTRHKKVVEKQAMPQPKLCGRDVLRSSWRTGTGVLGGWVVRTDGMHTMISNRQTKNKQGGEDGWSDDAAAATHSSSSKRKSSPVKSSSASSTFGVFFSVSSASATIMSRNPSANLCVCVWVCGWVVVCCC